MSNQQGTEAWRLDRVGNVTASMAKHCIAKTKTGWSKSREDYMMQLLAERLSGNPEDFYITKAMQWGMDQEENARGRYQDFTGYSVTKVGFIPHPTLKNCGASPDGVISQKFKDPEGLVEIKCPNTSTHIENCVRGAHDPQYEAQMTLQMLCALPDPWKNGGWCDMVSYDPRLPSPMDLVVNRYEFDPVFAKELVDGIRLFEDELNAKVLSFVSQWPEIEADYRQRWM